MNRDVRLKRLHFRAWHRGTKEADLMMGGYFDRLSQGWDEVAIEWFEILLNEDDVDIMAWAIGTQPAPERFRGAMLERMQKLDFIPIER
jgi:antitoxin CptB